MNTHADQTQENKRQAVSAVDSQIQSVGKSTFQFVDNRPEAVAQRKLQEMANNSPRVKQLRAFQDMANNSPQVNQAAQLQSIADNHSAQQQQPIQKKENNTGLPDNLKTGMENLSGMSLDDVKVHRNSNKPAQLQAHAYAQGTDIHLGPGQEKHLPHEAWHAVQQKQGRVKPTMQMKGKVNINDDAGLEKEADVMGAKASRLSRSSILSGEKGKSGLVNSSISVLQGAFEDHQEILKEELDEISEQIKDNSDQIQEINNVDDDDWDQDENGDKSALIKKLTEENDRLKDIMSQREDSAKNVYKQGDSAKKDSVGKPKMYLGRLDDTGPVKSAKVKKHGAKGGERVLNTDIWSPGVNDLFMGGGIDLQARFKFKTPLTPEAKELIINWKGTGEEFKEHLEKEGDDNNVIDENLYQPGADFEHRILATEIARLIDQGYVFAEVEAANPEKPNSFNAFASESEKKAYVNRKRHKRAINNVKAGKDPGPKPENPPRKKQ
jgi:hypothetical protein